MAKDNQKSKRIRTLKKNKTTLKYYRNVGRVKDETKDGQSTLPDVVLQSELLVCRAPGSCIHEDDGVTCKYCYYLG